VTGSVAAVVIGRNEGERLVRCLASMQGRVDRIVYVDSGSGDGSVEAARAMGAEIVELENSRPFTAARARTAGVDRLKAGAKPAFVQFVDGDCELRPGWIATAADFLDANDDVAVACGRRRERSPDATLWNRLIDFEWDTPVGEARACGGDALIRAKAFRDAGGYDPAFGARPLKRLIQQEIENALAKRILSGEFGEGDQVEVDAVGEVFEFHRAPEVVEGELVGRAD